MLAYFKKKNKEVKFFFSINILKDKKLKIKISIQAKT
jgi:hypothetical protein